MMQTEAEKAAWEMSKAEGFDLVTINPTFVLGPVIGDRADATSILCFKVRPYRYRQGASPCSLYVLLHAHVLTELWLQAFIENTAVDVMGYQVDVRDIAKAHVLAAEGGALRCPFY